MTWEGGGAPVSSTGQALRQAQGERCARDSRMAPTTGCGGGVGEARGLVVGVPRPASVPPFESLRTGFDFPQGERTPPPLWIPAFAGMTMGVCGPASATGGRGDPAAAGRAIREWPLRSRWGRLGGGGAPSGPSPLDSCLRRNDARRQGGALGASAQRSRGNSGRRANRPRPEPTLRDRRVDGRGPPSAAGPPSRPP